MWNEQIVDEQYNIPRAKPIFVGTIQGELVCHPAITNSSAREI